ncbi:nucleophosmin isoform X1 [Ornithorhynchus anatinus]|uniref:Nucleophosmin n=1 Tax=Ornithorhynchus anatinus TaxID=9258 RepID=F6YUB8_ORNAN|nr:nucleophosmin isoform X1 [Ornithorhynchus anatinus]
MEDSMDMDMSPLRPQNFLFGCELKADKDYHFKVDNDENEHQLSLRTVSLGAGAKDELHVIEAEALNYEGSPIKVTLASLKMSVQPTVSLGGFEITPPVVLRLKCGSGPVHVSGQHLVALEEDAVSDDDEEEEVKLGNLSGKRPAPGVVPKVPQKKAKLAELAEDEEEDDEDDEDDDEDEDEDDDFEEEEKTPAKKSARDTPAKNAQKSNQNGKDSKPSTPKSKGSESFKKQQEKSPRTPKGPLTVDDVKAKMQATMEKSCVLQIQQRACMLLRASTKRWCPPKSGGQVYQLRKELLPDV